MSNTHDRRAPGAARVPFNALVEVGGALGPSFEARAVNLSEEGMSLRTAYLPEVGQPVMCRFDAGDGMAVVAAGEVLWKDDMGNGGEFGIRFTNLDASSTVGLQRILGMAEDGVMPPRDLGRKVRLHIEGLAAPMRARIKDQLPSGVMAYSELGFLQMGRPVDLEDALSGQRRPALIDRIEIAVDDASRIPQLIVSLRYDDADGRAAAEECGASSHGSDPIPVHEGEECGVSPHDANRAEVARARVGRPLDGESNKLKTTFARGAAKVAPAIASWAKRARVTAALLAAKARRSPAGDDSELPIRRTTAPAPGGGLHAAGRKVVRGSLPEERFEEEPRPGFKITKKKAALAGGIALATVLVFVAVRRPASAPTVASAPTNEAAALTNPSPGNPRPAPVPPPTDPLAAAAAAVPAQNGGALVGKPGKATPFTNGPVGSRPTIIKVKMDGAIESIQGATQPTGFTIVIPNRKSVEPAAALADKDPRLAGVRVANEAGGAEFSVSFKDGVPNYLVRAHGDTLEMVLARATSHGEKAPEAHAVRKKHGKKH